MALNWKSDYWIKKRNVWERIKSDEMGTTWRNDKSGELVKVMRYYPMAREAELFEAEGIDIDEAELWETNVSKGVVASRDEAEIIAAEYMRDWEFDDVFGDIRFRRR